MERRPVTISIKSVLVNMSCLCPPPAPTHRATQLLPNTQQLGGEGYITSSRAGITHFVQRLAIILQLSLRWGSVHFYCFLWPDKRYEIYSTGQQHQDDRELLRSWTIWHHSLHSVLTTADNTNSAEELSQSEPCQGECGPIRGRQMGWRMRSAPKIGGMTQTMDKLVD